jgi:hypothetical protein
LKANALDELRQSLPLDDLLIEESLVLHQVVEETYQPKEILPADRLSLSLRAEFKALVITGTDLRILSIGVLDANIPTGFIPHNDTLAINTEGQPEFSNGIARWRFTAQRKLQAKINNARAIRLVLGFPPQKANERLQQSLPLESPPQIRLTPSWWPRLPILPFRMQIRQSGSS